MDRSTRALVSRRHLLQGAAGLALLAGCGQLPLQGQALPTPRKVARIGFLVNAAVPSGPSVNLDALRESLRALGYVEGENLVIDVRWGEGIPGRLDELAAELVAIPVDVIVTTGTPATAAASRATKVVPVVIAGISDPVLGGFAASLDRPGGNVTGVSNISPGLPGKQLQLFKEAVPSLSRAAVIWDAEDAAGTFEVSYAANFATTLGLELVLLGLHEAGDLEPAFDAARAGADGALVFQNTVAHAPGGMRQIAALEAERSLPAMHNDRRWVDAGGLMSFGPNTMEGYRTAASYVDKILKGADPAVLPIVMPTVFELVINLKTATALGITIPQDVLLQATELIQ